MLTVFLSEVIRVYYRLRPYLETLRNCFSPGEKATRMRSKSWLAANMMRRILVDHARRHRYAKRGGNDGIKVSLDAEQLPAAERDPDLVALDEALMRLAEMDSRKSQVVELRFFGGLTVEEAAEVLNISSRTVKREWSLAQAGLHSELKQNA
jgi:RNA polymerase sigma factor (TIGR02999 family)